MLRMRVSLQVRRVIVAAILATDMTCHFGLTEELKNVAVRSIDVVSVLLESKVFPVVVDDVPVELVKGDRDIILKTVLHAADISNPCKPWKLTKEWSDRVVLVRALSCRCRRHASLPPTVVLLTWCIAAGPPLAMAAGVLRARRPRKGGEAAGVAKYGPSHDEASAAGCELHRYAAHA